MQIDDYFKSLSIDIFEIEKILANNQLWYLDKQVQIAFKSLKNKPTNLDDNDWERVKEHFKQWGKNLLKENKIILGNRKEFFNDDDRKEISTAVIHHTSSKQDVDYNYINSIHLSNLYYPIYKSGFGKINGKFQPISSGHFYKGKQTFIGYHYLVYENGKIEQTLKDTYVGFHAGDYKTNSKSIGIAIVDDLKNKSPTYKAVKSVSNIIKKYPNIKDVIGHKEVIYKNKPLDTLCPGKKWSSWKVKIIDSIDKDLP